MLNDGQSGASVENRLPHTQHCTRLFWGLGPLVVVFGFLVVVLLVVLVLVVVCLLSASVVLLEVVVILAGHET